MSKIKIGVLISGGGTNLQSIIDQIHKSNENGEIVLIASNKKNAYGLTRGKENEIKTIYLNPKEYEDSDAYNEALLAHMLIEKVDLVILAGYLKILNHKWIGQYPNRIINIHPSLIPKFCGKGYYGLKVHQAAIETGESETGATVHLVDEGTDTGPILIQEKLNILKNETAEALQKRVLEIEHRILVEAVRYYCKHETFENLRG